MIPCMSFSFQEENSPDRKGFPSKRVSADFSEAGC
jgi:hypothetical protein